MTDGPRPSRRATAVSVALVSAVGAVAAVLVAMLVVVVLGKSSAGPDQPAPVAVTPEQTAPAGDPARDLAEIEELVSSIEVEIDREPVG